MSEKAKVEELIVLAEESLALSDKDTMDQFIVKTGEYLDELDGWQRGMNQSNPLTDETSSLSEAEKAALKGAIERLNSVHQSLMAEAGIAKDDVGSKMKEVHKRASGLRKYIDTGPQRVSITGKRKG